ncbi:MAG: hypothetical protein JWQ84_618 [Mucilaginibacter sp.]|nr:hypothetical protein [Mucilaginibacter sp.]MDB5140552.1 hypothetical protein [Mucilaginibacter sp.]
MKNLFFYSVFTGMLFFCFGVQAQNLVLGIRGGFSIPNLTAGSGNTNPLNTGYSSRLGADAGLFADFKFSNLFSLQPMVEYSSQGGKKDGLQAITTPDAIAAMYPSGQAPQYLYANYNSEARLNYLLIPVLAKFGWNFKNSPLRFYVDAGPFLGFLLNAHQVTSGQSQFYTDPAGTQPLPGGAQSFDNNQNIKDQLHTTNFGVEGNIGLSYHLGLSTLFIEGGGNFGFLNIQKNAQDGKNNTGAATATIGYGYWFGK